MSNQPKSASEMSCANCPMRQRSEANPKSLLARIWRWHTTWCPGWKAYQTALAREGTGKPQS